MCRDPRIVVSISDQNNPYNMVSIRGRVNEQISEDADEHTDRLAKKYLSIINILIVSPNEKELLKIIQKKYSINNYPDSD
jgi:hypothetical protein